MEFLSLLYSIIKVCRPTNVVMAAATQWLTFEFLIRPFVSHPVLQGWLLYQFILCTMLLAAGGFVINDILDVEADNTNKEGKAYIPKEISVKKAYSFYVFLLSAGAIISVVTALQIGKPELSLFYFIWGFLLYAYSRWLKGTILTGNILVSVFIAGTPGMVAFAESDGIFAIPDEIARYSVIEFFIVMVVLSFLVNVTREIVKDHEDKEGDIMAGIHTFAGRCSEKTVGVTITALLIFTIILTAVWMFGTKAPLALQHQTMLVLFVVAPLIIGIQIMTKSTHKRNFSDLSSLLKWVLASGVGCLIFIAQSILP